jgi:5-methylcytosine-specific restriction endonuclease McrA
LLNIVDFYKNDYISGVNGKKYPIPCVARTKRFFKINRSTIMFSRKNIFIRDDYTCQYCGSRLENDLTYDHVIPKSRWDYNKGSPTSWTNIVTACVQCNRKKGDKTPKEAKMSLKKLPITPSKTIRYLPITHHLHKIKDSIPNEWKIYLPNSYLE